MFIGNDWVCAFFERSVLWVTNSCPHLVLMPCIRLKYNESPGWIKSVLPEIPTSTINWILNLWLWLIYFDQWYSLYAKILDAFGALDYGWSAFFSWIDLWFFISLHHHNRHHYHHHHNAITKHLFARTSLPLPKKKTTPNSKHKPLRYREKNIRKGRTAILIRNCFGTILAPGVMSSSKPPWDGGYVSS